MWKVSEFSELVHRCWKKMRHVAIVKMRRLFGCMSDESIESIEYTSASIGFLETVTHLLRSSPKYVNS